MGVFDPKDPVKLEHALRERKKEVDELNNMVTKKKDQLQAILESIEEFKEINQSMNQYKEELYALLLRHVLEAKVKHVDAYVKLLEDEAAALLDGKAKPPS